MTDKLYEATKKEVMTEQEEYKKTLENKYGAINIDLNDGAYTKVTKDE